jgi:hypothetical protein
MTGEDWKDEWLLFEKKFHGGMGVVKRPNVHFLDGRAYP